MGARRFSGRCSPSAGRGVEQLEVAVRGNGLSRVADNLDRIPGEWRAPSLARLAFALRNERHSRTPRPSCSVKRKPICCRHRSNPALRPDVVAFFQPRRRRRRSLTRDVHTRRDPSPPGRGALIEAVRSDGSGRVDVVCGRLEAPRQYAWGSPVLADFATRLPHGGVADIFIWSPLGKFRQRSFVTCAEA